MRDDTKVHVPIDVVVKRSSALPDETLQEYAGRRLFFALRRFEDQVRRVTLRLTDENGPRRGVDTRCVLSVALHRGEPIVVQATSAWPTAAITEAARRLNEVVRRRLARARHHRAPSGDITGPAPSAA